MAFNASQGGRNRILEHLEEQKKRYLGGQSTVGGGAPTPSTSTVTSSSVLPSPVSPTVVVPPPVTSISTLPPDAAGMTSQQRTALQYAHANSVGYFITQDSSFGNLILPVLPRYADK